MFGLKFKGEANLSVVMLKPSLNACIYLSGVVHWFASLPQSISLAAALQHISRQVRLYVGKLLPVVKFAARQRR